MVVGPGKYDDLCTYVREQAEASGAIVIVFDGNKGPGFSCQATPGIVAFIPELLEDIARQIRSSSEQ